MAKPMTNGPDDEAQAKTRSAFTEPSPTVVPWIYVAPSGRRWVYAWMSPGDRDDVRLIVWTPAGKHLESTWPGWPPARGEAARLAARLEARGWTLTEQLDTGRGWVLMTKDR